ATDAGGGRAGPRAHSRLRLAQRARRAGAPVHARHGGGTARTGGVHRRGAVDEAGAGTDAAAGRGRGPAVKRLLPEPLLSAGLLALWLMLARSTSGDQILLGAILALVAPVVTAS